MRARRLVLFAVSLLGLGECFLAPGSLPNSRRGRSSVRMIAEPLATEAASSEAKSPEALLIENEQLKQKVLMLEDTIERTEGLCEPLMGGGGWAESLRSRATWLIGLLIAQSASSFILADNENLLATHPTVIFFLTMLVGAGGNAGNQASVRLIRGLATGEVNGSREQTLEIFANEARVALALGGIRECTPCAMRPERSRPRSAPPPPRTPPPACLAPHRLNAWMLAVAVVAAGFVRVVAFDSQAASVDALAISASLFLIVTTSVMLGTVTSLHPRHRTHGAQRDAPLLITPRPAAYQPLYRCLSPPPQGASHPRRPACPAHTARSHALPCPRPPVSRRAPPLAP